MIEADSTTFDACGTRYAFTSYTDRCPVCCPKSELEDDSFDNDEQLDEVYDDDSGFPSRHADQTQQTACLERHNLLTDAERKGLPVDAFEPVRYVKKTPL